MASKNNAITCKIFLGFGGSGAKTLVELARMFAADKEWAQRCESEAYFLLADTDADDLHGFEQEIRTTLAHVGAHSWVRSVQLSQGVPRMDRLITERMTAARKTEGGLKRIKDCWWFDGEDQPFIARNVQLPPSEGASQCPAISYFLAWNSIGGDASPVGRVIEDLCNEMQSRIARNHGARDFDVKLYLVAGLAGGTGRGSWATLSFKIQSALQARGKNCMPIGMFFDQSCFADVAQGTQGQRVKLVINSLTGISEIAGWIENDLDRGRKAGKSPRYLFRLPSFASPERPSSDVVDARALVETDEQAGASPVRQAFLIFADGPAGRLQPGSHYKVAAAALYGRTAQSAIESEQSNTRLDIGSVGAASVRVDVDSIREYLRKRVEYETVKRFADGVEKKAAGEIVDAILLPLLVDVQADRGRRGADDSAERGSPQLLARLHRAALTATAARIDELLDSLESTAADDYEEAVSRIGGQLAKDARFLANVAGAVRESIAHVFGDGVVPAASCAPEDLFVHYARNAMRAQLDHPTSKGSKLDAHVWSFAVAQQVLEGLAKQCGEIETRLAEAKAVVKAADVVAFIRKRRGKKMLVLGKRFDEDELADVKKTIEDFVLGQARIVVAKLFEKWTDGVRRSLHAWRDNLEDAKERALRHAEALEKDVDEVRTDDLFTVDADFKRAEKAVLDDAHHDPETFLQPYVRDGQFAEWMKELLNQRDDRMQVALSELAQYVLDNAYGVDGSGKQDDEKRKEVRRELGRKLDDFAGNVVIPAAFLNRHFRLGDVAEKLVHAWAARIEKASSNPRGQENLNRRFLRIFGFELKMRGNQCEVPSKKEILELMALRLGQNCRAQFNLRGGSGRVQERAATHVFLPADNSLVKGPGPAKEWRKSLDGRAKQDANHRVNFHVGVEGDEELGEERGNPFVMMACVTEGFSCENPDVDPADQGVVHLAFERISSLDYWRAANDPHVKTFLDWVEDPSGRSMFANVSYSFGLGYTLPAFVTNEQLRKSRWRPWATDAEKRLERQGSVGVDLILYALLGTDGDRKSTLFHLTVAGQEGQESSWSLPILGYGEGKDSKHGFAFLRQAFTDETGEWRAKAKAYRAGDEETSLKKLVARFAADDALRAAIAHEAAQFFGVLAMEEGLRERDVNKAFVALHDWLDGDLRGALEGLGNYEIDYRDLVDQLVARALQLSKMSRSELASHFKA
jgi:hypothetical protein